ncbi:MAG: biotin/lipoyl-binding protein, partial [Acidobacteria bacterium]|nr:biotin/lipoyl-binding protein [Acidobacteriota bacterium]
MKKKVIIPVVVIAGLGITGAIVFRDMERTDPNTLMVSGNIELTEVNIAFKTAGKLVERTVDEGDPVKAGMVIARLDRDQLLRQREREVAGLVLAEAQLKQSETAVQWQRATLVADLELRRADRDAMEAKLRELKNGSRPQEIQEAKAMVEAAQSEYDRAKNDWERGQTLHKNDDISTSQYDQYRMRFESAQATLKQAKERAALVVAGPRNEAIDAAAAQVERASASLRVGEANKLELARFDLL